ncbi:MAG: 3-oxoacyl-ACP synthase [Saprospiraceae bacterium]|nr:3-oxoacyl-ACP synthase [Saprospiraceae bacterium]
MELFQLKQAAFNYCQTAIAKRIHTIEMVLKSLEESRNNESKSSVGDKYETGRAMLHLEEEKNKIQLAEALLARSVLESIHLEKTINKVEIGSLVITNSGKYFVAIGLGKILIDKELIYGISLDSPIGQVLKDKKVGDQCSFNERLIRIDAIV